jgi:putative flavoprotein involved in K+ transport
MDALVIGGGPAGIATSRELSRLGVGHLVLERGDQPGFVWANLYDSLTLHTGRHMSGLPGMPIPRSVPLFPPRPDFVAYLHDYVRTFRLPVRTGIDVLKAERHNSGWRLETSAGTMTTRALVMATGIVSSPRMPSFPGMKDFGGRMLHSSQYRRPSDVPEQRILVVGVGNSGGEIGSELARAGRRVDIAVRSGANVVPRALAGIPIQYLAFWLRKLPRTAQVTIADVVRRLGEMRRGPSPLPRPSVGPLDAIPLIGFALVDAIREGLVTVRAGVREFVESGARFTDGSSGEYDAVVLATGFRPALAPLGDIVRRDDRGFALRSDRVTSADVDGLWFVGHNYDATGGLANIRRDSTLAAKGILQWLGRH